MSANNPVFNVLIPTGDQGVLAAGNRPSALAVGQIGVFSYETGLSVSAATVVNERAVYLAVGLDTDGDTVQDDIRQSAGTHISRKGVTDYNLRCYNPAQNHIVDVTNISTVNCEEPYSLKVEFRGNSNQYMNYGFNQFTKTFSVKSACCGPGCDCPSGDCNDLVGQLVDAINADEDGLLSAAYIDYTTTPGTPAIVSAANVAAWITANPGLCLGIRITCIPTAVKAFCKIPAKYYKMLQFKINVTLLDKLYCQGTVATWQEPSYEEGNANDIGYLEYEANGWEESPYRVGELAGIPITEFEKLAVTGTAYNQVNLHYMNESVAGWSEHKNKLNTIIAVPCTGSNVTLAALLPILDAFTDNFDALTDDLANCDCTTVQQVSDIDDVATDGIG